MTTTKSRKAQPEITAPAIFRIVNKLTKQCLGYGVPSDTQPGVTYFVSWNYTLHQYQCNCPATTKSCKHVRAVQSICEARKQIAVPRHLGSFLEELATFAEQEVARMAVAEAEQVVQEVEEAIEPPAPVPPVAATTAPTIAPKPVITTKPIAVAVTTKAPTITNKGNAPLNGNRSVRVAAGVPMR